MRRAYFLPGFVIAFATAASAQTIVFKPGGQSMAPGIEQVRVTLGVNMFIPAQGDSEQALKAQESGRRMVYDLAAHECDILRDALASDCRLESINVNVQRTPANQYGGQQRVEGFTMNGNIGLRIVPK